MGTTRTGRPDAFPLEELAGTTLFRGVSAEEVGAMLACLGARRVRYAPGEFVMREGTPARQLGVVLEGAVTVERTDAWGVTSILGRAEAGETFAEAYACAGEAPLGVDVRAATESAVLLLDVGRVLRTCPSACAFHARLVQNLLGAVARRNLSLSEKIDAITPRTIRARVLSYLSALARRAGSRHVRTPYSRQQLADYLCVDRSALSHELSKMRAEGLVDFDRASFTLLGGAVGDASGHAQTNRGPDCSGPQGEGGKL